MTFSSLENLLTKPKSLFKRHSTMKHPMRYINLAIALMLACASNHGPHILKHNCTIYSEPSSHEHGVPFTTSPISSNSLASKTTKTPSRSAFCSNPNTQFQCSSTKSQSYTTTETGS